MNFLRIYGTELMLRLGLGVMYLYSGYDLFVHPKSWSQFVPYWFSQAITPIMPVATFIKVQGIVEVIIGSIFLIWILPRPLVRIAAIVSAIELAGILLFFGVDLITFRDLGVLGASLALVFVRLEPVRTVVE